MGLYFEECNMGDEWISASRTLDHADVMSFAGLTGDYAMVHTSEEFAKKSIFGKRFAHGMLGLSVSIGLLFRLGLVDGTAMAFLNSNVNFTGPIFLGDTLHIKVSIKSRRETKKSDRGIVVFGIQMINQRAEVVQDGEHTIMMARK